MALSSGLTDTNTLPHADSMRALRPTVDNWLFHRYQTGGTTPFSTFTNADRPGNGVSDPAPESVYQSLRSSHQQYRWAASWSMSFDVLDDGYVPDGCDFISPDAIGRHPSVRGSRMFDIDVSLV